MLPKVFKYCGVNYATLGEALQAAFKKSPFLRWVYTAVLSISESISNSAFGQAIRAAEQKLLLAQEKVASKILGKTFASIQEKAKSFVLKQRGRARGKDLRAMTDVEIKADPVKAFEKKHGKFAPGDEGKLLPKEGTVGTFKELAKSGKRGDNLARHHIPHDDYMKTKGISRNEGIGMLVEEPNPGIGGRHRKIHKVLSKQGPNMKPRDALAQGIKRAREVYQEEGAYTSDIQKGLKEVIKQNKDKFPNLFKKKK